MPRLFALLLAIAACARANPASAEGLWRTDGWATVYRISGPERQAFEVTTTTCVSGLKATRPALTRSS